LRIRHEEIETQKVYFERTIQTIREKHDTELNVIVKKMEMLSEANEQFMAQNTQYIEIEREIQELRRVIKTNKTLTDGVDHLWRVK
jgi:uncharacterized coiled-coil DUF342 family protein